MHGGLDFFGALEVVGDDAGVGGGELFEGGVGGVSGEGLEHGEDFGVSLDHGGDVGLVEDFAFEDGQFCGDGGMFGVEGGGDFDVALFCGFFEGFVDLGMAALHVGAKGFHGGPSGIGLGDLAELDFQEVDGAHGGGKVRDGHGGRGFAIDAGGGGVGGFFGGLSDNGGEAGHDQEGEELFHRL